MGKRGGYILNILKKKRMENEEKIGIENIKGILLAVVSIVKTVKTTGRPLISVLFNIGKVLKIRFKLISAEVRDLDELEYRELVTFLIENGIPLRVAEKALKNLESTKLTTILNLSKTLLLTR